MYYYDNVNDFWVVPIEELKTLNDYFIHNRTTLFINPDTGMYDYRPIIRLKITNIMESDFTSKKIPPILNTYIDLREGDWLPQYYILNDSSCYAERIKSMNGGFRNCSNIKLFEGFPDDVEDITECFHSSCASSYYEGVKVVNNIPQNVISDLAFDNSFSTVRFIALLNVETYFLKKNQTYLSRNVEFDVYYINESLNFSLHRLSYIANVKNLFFKTEKMRRDFLENGLTNDFINETGIPIEELAKVKNPHKLIKVRNNSGTSLLEVTPDRNELINISKNTKKECSFETVVNLSTKTANKYYELFRTRLVNFKQLNSLTVRNRVVTHNFTVGNIVRYSDRLVKCSLTFDKTEIKSTGSYTFDGGMINITVGGNEKQFSLSLFYPLTLSFRSGTELTVNDCTFISEEELPPEIVVPHPIYQLAYKLNTATLRYGYFTLESATKGTEYNITDYDMLVNEYCTNCPIRPTDAICYTDFSIDYDTTPQVTNGYDDDTLCLYDKGQKYYAQPVLDEWKDINTSRCGHLLRFQKDDKSVLLSKYIGDTFDPFVKQYQSLTTITNDVNELVIPKESFPKGGVIVVCGGAGESVSDGGQGGYGQKKMINIPANPKNDLVLSIGFQKISEDGKTASYTAKEYVSSRSNGYDYCNPKTTTAYGTSGGEGGLTPYVTALINNKEYSVHALGGGGGGGGKAKWEGYISTSGSSSGGMGTCRDWKTYYSDFAKGGAYDATDSTTANASDVRNGGSIVKQEELEAVNKLSTAYVEIGVF